MCICHRWPPPVYEMTCEEGLPHERQFTMACIVFKYREVGSGKSKKLAKRQAAHKMWEKLQQCSPLPQLGYQDEVIIIIIMEWNDFPFDFIFSFNKPFYLPTRWGVITSIQCLIDLQMLKIVKYQRWQILTVIKFQCFIKI